MSGARIYMDHAAGSPLRPAAADALQEALTAGYGNPDSPHREGQRARAALERARGAVADVLNVPPRTVVFTGGGTEAARIALVGAAAAHSGAVLHSALEHPAIAGPAAMLASQGRDVRVAPVGLAGVADEAQFLAVSEGCAVAALLAVHHETGLAQPVAAVAAALRERGTVLVCDAALAPGRIPLQPLLADVPLVSLSAHKFGGPPGVGVLVVAPGTVIQSPACGGVQEERVRGGTPSVAGALATAEALREACAEQASRAEAYAGFAHTLGSALTSLGGWKRVGNQAPRTGIHCFEVPNAEGEAVMMNLDLLDVAVATGSSCALGGTDPSPGLLAMGFDAARAARTIRISFGWNTMNDDVKTLCERIRTTMNRLAGLSTK